MNAGAIQGIAAAISAIVTVVLSVITMKHLRILRSQHALELENQEQRNRSANLELLTTVEAIRERLDVTPRNADDWVARTPDFAIPEDSIRKLQRDAALVGKLQSDLANDAASHLRELLELFAGGGSFEETLGRVDWQQVGLHREGARRSVGRLCSVARYGEDSYTEKLLRQAAARAEEDHRRRE